MSTLLRSLTVLGILTIGGCAVGPDYRRPATPDMPAAWSVQTPWRAGVPGDAHAKGAWWERFGDPDLTRLEQAALAGNQTLAQAAARLAQARASVDANTAAQLPQVSLQTRAQRLQISGNRPLTNYNSPNFSTVQNDFAVGLAVSYEADLFGRVRRTVEGATASAQQSAADLENARLVLTADLANNYFSLRQTDTELDVVARSIGLQRRALDLAAARHDLGAASGLDVAQQQALIDTTLTQVDLLRRQRGQYEHAIATLTGQPAPGFGIAPRTPSSRSVAAGASLSDISGASSAVASPSLASTPLPLAAQVVVPLGVPSDVLQRRPDVASAERAMAAANAQIGIASAAYYPSFILNPAYGFDSASLTTLFNAPSLLWSFGVSATQNLFAGGRLDANVNFAKAGYEGAVAGYRRTVLTALQEVEDGITGVATLDSALAQAQRAAVSAQRVLDIANDRYEGGVSTYLDVITAQQSLLNNERQLAQLGGQRMLVSVFLIKALGGDWGDGTDTSQGAGGE